MAKVREQEIVLTYLPWEGTWRGWTDMPAVMKKWKRLGWPVQVHGSHNGEARSWVVQVPQRAVTFRRPAPSAARVAAGKRMADRNDPLMAQP